MVDQPVPEEGEEGSSAEEPQIAHIESLATYGLRLHLSREAGANLEALTLDELSEVLGESLRSRGYRVGIRAERTDK